LSFGQSDNEPLILEAIYSKSICIDRHADCYQTGGLVEKAACQKCERPLEGFSVTVPSMASLGYSINEDEGNRVTWITQKNTQQYACCVGSA